MVFDTSQYGHIAELIFVGDPMCSWCYGFSPELTKLREELKGVPFSMIMGGLRDGEIFDEAKLKNHLGYWQAVHEATGLPFDATALSQKGFNYTTEPACRAVVTVRAMDSSKAYSMYTALQKAFYAEGRDITQEKEIAGVAASTGLDIIAFLEMIDRQGHLSQIRGYKKYEELLALIKR